MEENEERSMIEPKSFENPKLKELIRVLMDWINDELHTERIIVQVSCWEYYDDMWWWRIIKIRKFSLEPPVTFLYLINAGYRRRLVWWTNPPEIDGKVDWRAFGGTRGNTIGGRPEI